MNGTGSIKLCRGAKGQERVVWEESLFSGTRCCEDLTGKVVRPMPKRERRNHKVASSTEHTL
jgi:hypothetical protein